MRVAVLLLVGSAMLSAPQHARGQNVELGKRPVAVTTRPPTLASLRVEIDGIDKSVAGLPQRIRALLAKKPVAPSRGEPQIQRDAYDRALADWNAKVGAAAAQVKAATAAVKKAQRDLDEAQKDLSHLQSKSTTAQRADAEAMQRSLDATAARLADATSMLPNTARGVSDVTATRKPRSPIRAAPDVKVPPRAPAPLPAKRAAKPSTRSPPASTRKTTRSARAKSPGPWGTATDSKR